MDRRKSFKEQFKKRCFDFSLSVLRFCDVLGYKKSNFSLIDQLIRAATSIGANIIEGGNSSSKKEFINYFQIALRSASETLYWLALLEQINVNKKEEISSFINECTEIKKIISTVVLNTKQNSKL